MNLIKKNLIVFSISISSSCFSFVTHASDFTSWNSAVFSTYTEALIFCQSHDCKAIIESPDSRDYFEVLYIDKPGGEEGGGPPGKDEIYP
jgi:hypothetical protein